MNNKSFLALIAIFVVVMIASSSVYIVTEYQRAVVLRFGRLVNVDVPPGLHVKIPFADVVKKFDGRLLTADMRPESFYTVENKRLIVDSYIKYRINNVENYYKATGGDEVVDRKSTRLNSSHVKISYAVFCLKKKMSKSK